MKTIPQLTATDRSAIETLVIQKLYEALPKAVYEAVHASLHNDALVTAEREIVNGVKAPAPGGKCWTIWNELDTLLITGSTPTLQDVFTLANDKKWNRNNARIEFYQWRHFHGYGKNKANHRNLERRTAKPRGRKVTKERRVAAERRAVAPKPA